MDIETEAQTVAIEIVSRATEPTTWLLGAEWNTNKAGTRTSTTRPSGLRWTYLGNGEFRLTVVCKHCGNRFGVSGIKDATTYLRREALLRRHNGTCPECAPKLRECRECRSPHLPDPGRGGRCESCHRKAAAAVAAAAEDAAYWAAQPAEVIEPASRCRKCHRRLSDFDRAASARPDMCFDCA